MMTDKIRDLWRLLLRIKSIDEYNKVFCAPAIPKEPSNLEDESNDRT